MSGDSVSLNRCPAPLPRLDDLFKDVAQKIHAARKNISIKGANDATAVHPSDVIQGQHKNCFLVAAMAAVAQQHPDPDAWMEKAISTNPNGTYDVTFWDKQPDGTYKANVVNVTGEFRDPASSNEPGEMWPAIIEKAYAQAYGNDASPYAYGFGDGGGLATVAMEHLTGKPSTYTAMTDMSLNALADAHAKGFAITAGTHDTNTGPVVDLPGPLTADDSDMLPGYDGTPYTGSTDPRERDITPWHVYYVTGVDPGTGMVQVHNVWHGKDGSGRKDINIPFEDFQRSFKGVHMNPVQ